MAEKEISSNALRELYQEFFETKGHARIPSAPLVPENDPSVLFTTAGMHPLVPYLKGEPHPAGSRLTNAQKCLRTTDIGAVGDAAHATVFEMLGNWSLGDYFKREAIEWSWEFLTGSRWLGIDPKYLAVSVFGGDETATRDATSYQLWQEVGVPQKRVAFLGKEDNWWPSGGQAAGPQGPDTEMFYWAGGAETPPLEFNPTDSRWVEIWNDVFMEFDSDGKDVFTRLKQPNVDTGMGLERTVMALSGAQSIYEIDSFRDLMQLIAEHTRRQHETHRRVVADHIKAATFLLGDERPVTPSNTDQGYVLRRIIRRAVRSCRILGVAEVAELLTAGSNIMIRQYEKAYPSLGEHASTATAELANEAERFLAILPRGIKKVAEILQMGPGKDISGPQAFELYATYGLPIELVVEEAKRYRSTVDLAGFNEEMARHQETSRTAAAGRFKGGLVDQSEQSVRYHTATHLLHQALREVLGTHVVQKGSNITAERLRFDFGHGSKLTDDEIAQIEALVNRKIAASLPVQREEMTVAEAKQRGALGLFEKKYADRVSVYSIGDFSVEVCGGPHVASTGGLGTFRITVEESVGSGRRRVKAVLE
jgi:alanyl-tRNA synthetase